MKSEKPEKRSRREFLRTLGRTTILGSIGALVGMLFPRISRPDIDAHTCIGRGLCRRCGRLDDCILPQALSARKKEGGRMKAEE